MLNESAFTGETIKFKTLHNLVSLIRHQIAGGDKQEQMTGWQQTEQDILQR